ncbi:scavenger receptor cysteine-rich domain-containing protein DMBT1-like [Ptychodera flava]|uniref:scavenger receptor cysteine-rich domain-containing protein DMBT1-like n=1 Tax=Ptychodera flava TaxID=63121 RepID=UPI003969CAB2
MVRAQTVYGLGEAALHCTARESLVVGVGGTVYYDAKYGEGSGPVWFDNIRCTGNEESIFECGFSENRKNSCGHYQDVSVSCTSTPNEGDVRLRENLLEVYHLGQWGTVCDDNFDMKATAVVCRQLGYGSGRPGYIYHHDTGSIWLDDVRCTGNEIKLTQCAHNGWGEHNCVHSEVVHIDCENEIPIRLADGVSSHEGRVEIYHNNEWGTVCDDNFNENAALVVCRQLGFTSVGATLARFGQGSGPIWLDGFSCNGNEPNLTTPQDSNVRLVGGSTPESGRLEIYHDGIWGTVCDDYFTSVDADVVCRELGFWQSSLSSSSSTRSYGQGSGTIWLDDVECQGREISLVMCSHRGWGTHNCGHSEDVGIICDTLEGGIRLANGEEEFEGRLEVYFNGEWNTVCDDEFDARDAAVVCRQLGYSGGEVQPQGRYGQGFKDISLDNVDCTGHELVLQKCGHRGWGEHNCVHDEDVSVHCKLPEVGSVRLVGGTWAYEGRLEIFDAVDSRWESVCASGVDDRAASVVCRQLGFRGGTSGSSQTFGQGSSNIFIKDVDCQGLENSLMECSHSTGGDGCGSSNLQLLVIYRKMETFASLMGCRLT